MKTKTFLFLLFCLISSKSIYGQGLGVPFFKEVIKIDSLIEVHKFYQNLGDNGLLITIDIIKNGQDSLFNCQCQRREYSSPAVLKFKDLIVVECCELDANGSINIISAIDGNLLFNSDGTFCLPSEKIESLFDRKKGILFFYKYTPGLNQQPGIWKLNLDQLEEEKVAVLEGPWDLDLPTIQLDQENRIVSIQYYHFDLHKIIQLKEKY